MMKTTTLRIPPELANQVEVIARVQGTSFNAFIVKSVEGEVERLRANKNFISRARKVLDRDRELLDRLAQ